MEQLSEFFAARKDTTINWMDSERDHLFQQVGKLQVEVDWIKTSDICYEYH
jgi:hypothetical protein